MLKIKGKHIGIRALLPVTIIIAVFTVGCANLNPIPDGSKKLGVCKGSFGGTRLEGDVQMTVYQTPDGSLSFKGFLSPGIGYRVNWLGIYGDIRNGRMEGSFQGQFRGKMDGKTSGTIKQLSGNYSLISPLFDNGTWKAECPI